MDKAGQQIVEAIKGQSNILVTVSTNPSVDELSAALGLTLLLDHLDKRATSVFSGAIPPAIDFLEPGKTFENSADSLRDFIIALDKEKADHLRYKVEGEAVKIFITPYKTKLSQDDLEFSQGDYNVELIIALGVRDQGHLDKALESHGKILHDATVMTVTVGSEGSSLGSFDWHDDKASSLSEMIAKLADALKGEQPLLDQQVSTALLTGIVSATDRFSNDHTTAGVMTIAAQLMAAGANQQLIAAKLEEGHDIGPGTPAAQQTSKGQSPQELSIKRPRKEKKTTAPATDTKTAATPGTEDQSSSKTTVDQDTSQKELEKQLEEIAGGATTGTMADIEQQLNDAQAEQSQPQEVPMPESAPPTPSPQPQPGEVTSAPVPESQAAPALPIEPAPAPRTSADTSPDTPQSSEVATPPVQSTPDATLPADVPMPDFEPTGDVSPKAAPAPDPEPQQPVQDSPSPPPLIQQRSFLGAPSDGSSANSPDQEQADDGTTPANPFDSSPPTVRTHEVQPATDIAAQNGGGTPEGAALLGSSDDASPTQLDSSEQSSGIPQLPPLPPMPSDPSRVPLPPPPPPPPMDAGTPATSPMPSGPVSGDVFGDKPTSDVAQPQAPAATTPPQPGQFRIPGQG